MIRVVAHASPNSRFCAHNITLSTEAGNESNVLLLAIAVAPFLSTFAGGLLALKLHDKLHLILGFSAGAVIGVAFFDLLPEAIEFGGRIHAPAAVLACAALGFLSYLVLDRVL